VPTLRLLSLTGPLLCLALGYAGAGCSLFAAPCEVDDDCDEGACSAGFCDTTTAPTPDDAGPVPRDAGSNPVDAGPLPDAGPIPDAGLIPDSGPIPDAGSPADAGPILDAGAQPSFASTLDDEDAIITPLHGASTGYVLTTTTAPAFFADLVATPPHVGLLLDAAGERLELPLAGSGSINADMRQGTLSLDFKPAYAFDDDERHPIFALETLGTLEKAGVRLRKAGDSNLNQLQLVATDGTNFFQIEVPTATFVLSPGEWHRITCTWDLRDDSPELHLYVDGTERGAQPSSPPRLTMSSPDASQTLTVGGWTIAPNQNAFGLFDNLEVWQDVRPPPAP